MFRTIMCIGLGSFTGGVLRYYLSKGIQQAAFMQFPFGTMAVNLLGCFLIGLFYGLFDRGALMSPNLRLFLTVGFCGGFTTFSTFMNENFQLAKDGNILLFALYSAISLGGGFLLLALGHFIIKCYG
ncbi:MAG: fluoride efflux transporter CrcB [Bacteroidaceae bacterium]|nr:fluoride efflux transporter CrcB [Bacteroidaceae bacterium]